MSSKKPATQEVQRRDLNAAQRVALALKLRAARMTYEEIAQKCGYENRGTAWRAVQRELQRNISANVEEMRREELAMLDQLQAECYTRMKDKTHEKQMLFAVDRLLQISERRAKLLGLDAKTETKVDIGIDTTGFKELLMERLARLEGGNHEP